MSTKTSAGDVSVTSPGMRQGPRARTKDFLDAAKAGRTRPASPAGTRAIQTLEERLDELERLLDKVDQEIRRVAFAIKSEPKSTKRSRYVVPDCGTESGYQRHHFRGEKCDECRVAHAKHTAQAARRRRLLARGEVA